MKQVNLIEKKLVSTGEEISHELGAKMVKDFQDNHPDDVTANFIGRNILENILAQPDCMGIRFYNAINEKGRKTLVYVGIDSEENIISEYIGVDNSGALVTEKGIIADRAGQTEDGTWGWWNTVIKH